MSLLLVGGNLHTHINLVSLWSIHKGHEDLCTQKDDLDFLWSFGHRLSKWPDHGDNDCFHICKNTWTRKIIKN
jgi:hypothetical protein